MSTMSTRSQAPGCDATSHRSTTARHSSGRGGLVGRWALALLVGIVALLAFGPLATAQAAGTASIEGNVTATKGGAGVVGIEVRAVGPEEGTATTGALGKFKIDNLVGGGYTVSFIDKTQKFVALNRFVTLTEGKSELLSPTLTETGSISGRVTSAASGNGLFANVRVSSVESGDEESVNTNPATGEYTIEHLAPGTYSVTFSALEGSYVPQFTSTAVKEGETTANVNAALKESGKISGRVTDAVTHAGLAKINVFASSTDGVGSAITNANGEYTVTGLPPGSYKVGFSWQFSEAEIKEFEHAPRFIPKYIEQFYNGQVSEATADTVGVAEGGVSSGINAAMVPSLPTNTAVPAISGSPAVGSKLSCSSGSWTGEPQMKLSVGWPLISPFGYQWLRDGVVIVGASSDAYVLQAGDVGHSFVCEVTATNEAGHASAKSSPFAVVNPVPVIKISASKFKVVKGVAKIGIACANAPCVGTLKAIQKVLIKHRKSKGKTITKKQTMMLGAGSYSLAAGKTGTVTLRLTGAGKKRLAHAPHHRLSPKLIASVVGGKQLEKVVQLSAAKK
jgi:hypothetical protein